MLEHTITFKVAGITFENEDGKDIQKEIKRILKEYKKEDYFDDFYGGYTNSEIKESDLNVSEYEGYKFPAKLEGDEYNGADCLKIYFKTYNNEYIHIGYAPKAYLEEITEWITKEGIRTDGKLEVTGGKYKYCELYEEDYEEKERVAIKELTYGAEITLSFYNDSREDVTNNDTKDEISKVLSELKKEDNIDKYKQKEIKSTEQNANIAIGITIALFIGIAIFIFSKIWWLIDTFTG